MFELLQQIFPKVHQHPSKPLHQFHTSADYDPMLADLRPEEHGCGPVSILYHDFEKHGKLSMRKVVIQ